VSTVINFVNGLNQGDDEEEEDETQVIQMYSQELFETLVTLLKKAIQVSYEPLQEEVMSLLSAVA
jgi:hypothetical protein